MNINVLHRRMMIRRQARSTKHPNTGAARRQGVTSLAETNHRRQDNRDSAQPRT